MKEIQALEKNDAVVEAIKRISEIEKQLNPHEEAVILFRFREGCALKEFFARSTAENYGKKVIYHIAQKTLVSSMTLYRAHDLALQLNYDEKKLKEKIKEIRASGRKPSIAFLSGTKKCIPLSDEAKEIQKEMLLRDTECGAEAFELAKQEFGEDDEEIQGVEIGYNQAIGGNGTLLEDGRIYAPENWTEYHNRKYEEFLAEQPCCITGASPVTLLQWAFTKENRTASDLLSLPIDESLTAEYESLGSIEFFKKHGLNPFWVSIRYVQQFIMRETVPF